MMYHRQPTHLQVLVLCFVMIYALTTVARQNPVQAAGSTYYVDIQNPSCDNNGAGSLAVPWCTLNKAVVTLNAGDTAYVAPGTYDISSGGYLDDIAVPGNGTTVGLHPAQAGTVSNPIRLIAQTTAADIIGGGNTAQDDAHQAFITNGLFLVDQDYWQLDGFYVRLAGQLMSANNTGFEINNSLIFVEPQNEAGAGGASGGLTLYNSDAALVNHIEAWSILMRAVNWPTGMCSSSGSVSVLSISFSDSVTVRDSLLYGSGNVHNVSGSSNLLFENNTFLWGGHLGGPDTNTGSVTNFVYRNNIFAGWGQEGPFVRPWCTFSGTIDNGQIYNNLNLFIGGPRFETASSTYPPFCSEAKMSNITIRNELIIKTSAADHCFASWPPNVNLIDSDYNLCIYQADHEQKNWWRIDQIVPDKLFTLAQWQTQNEYPQTVQDPHSRHLGPADGDPGFTTPLAELGQIENIVECETYFPSLCQPGQLSNCAPPYRLRPLDDYTVKSDSILRSGGDPAYEGGRIGPFSYTAEENQLPLLLPIGPKTAHERDAINFTVIATDEDVGDTLTFTAEPLPSGALFTDHGDRTATFAWTPSDQQSGEYPVTVTVSDGTDTDTEDITITVLDGASNCDPDWQCTNWSACTSGLQARTCTDVNRCGTDAGRPSETAVCDSVAPGKINNLQAQ